MPLSKAERQEFIALLLRTERRFISDVFDLLLERLDISTDNRADTTADLRRRIEESAPTDAGDSSGLRVLALELAAAMEKTPGLR